MGHAYTPGLKVTEHLLVRKRRILPLKGEVLVKVGDQVNPDDVVARTFLPGEVVPINVANKLGVPPEDVKLAMKMNEGDPIKKGDILAETKSLFIFTSTCNATIDGTIESISAITGQLLQRGHPARVEVKAYVSGTVTEVIPEEGVVIDCSGAFVQGIFGIGGETNGDIKVAVSDHTAILSDDLITEDFRDKIIIGGSLVTAKAMRKSIKVGARGIVVGGFDDKDLRDFLGYDIGVAITGNEQLGLTLVVTEGFGQIDMACRTFDLLKAHEGEMACINGATQIRAGVIRPEVVVPTNTKFDDTSGDETIEGLKIGSPVRVIRHPHFGSLGDVVELPSQLHKLESESMARVLKVKFESGDTAIIPRANVEMIEG